MPVAYGRDIISRVVKESRGSVITVGHQEMIDGVREIAKKEGVLMAPEGGALWKGIQKLVDQEEISREEKVLMVNTGSGYKYLEHLV